MGRSSSAQLVALSRLPRRALSLGTRARRPAAGPRARDGRAPWRCLQSTQGLAPAHLCKPRRCRGREACGRRRASWSALQRARARASTASAWPTRRRWPRRPRSCRPRRAARPPPTLPPTTGAARRPAAPRPCGAARRARRRRGPGPPARPCRPAPHRSGSGWRPCAATLSLRSGLLWRPAARAAQQARCPLRRRAQRPRPAPAAAAAGANLRPLDAVQVR